MQLATPDIPTALGVGCGLVGAIVAGGSLANGSGVVLAVGAGIAGLGVLILSCTPDDRTTDLTDDVLNLPAGFRITDIISEAPPPPPFYAPGYGLIELLPEDRWEFHTCPTGLIVGAWRRVDSNSRHYRLLEAPQSGEPLTGLDDLKAAIIVLGHSKPVARPVAGEAGQPLGVAAHGA